MDYNTNIYKSPINVSSKEKGKPKYAIKKERKKKTIKRE